MHLVDQQKRISEPITQEDSSSVPLLQTQDIPYDNISSVPGENVPSKNALIETTVEDAIIRARGLYINGDVGTGKTVVMDIFFDNCEIQQKKRVHFHQFMLDIHQRTHLYKKRFIS